MARGFQSTTHLNVLAIVTLVLLLSGWIIGSLSDREAATGNFSRPLGQSAVGQSAIGNAKQPAIWFNGPNGKNENGKGDDITNW